MVSTRKSRSRSCEAPASPLLYQPRCLRNSMPVRRVSPCRRSARVACSSATRNRSAAAGAGGSGPPRSSAWPSRKIHGLPKEPRPTMIAAQPVWRWSRRMSAPQVTSPFPITGIERASTTRAISSQLAWPVNIWVRVRAWRVNARAPASCIRSAIPTGSRVSSFQPLRVFTVTGTGVAATTARMIRSTSSRSRRHAEPPHHLFRGAAEVDVDELRPIHLGHDRGGAAHRLCIGAVDLDPDRPLDLLELGALERLPDAAADRLGGEKLRHEDVGAEATADLPERRLRHPGHGGEDQRDAVAGEIG